MASVAAFAVPSVEELEATTHCTTYDEPREVACFSRGADRVAKPGDVSQLRRFHRPEIGVDLNEGFESFVDKDKNGGLAPLTDILKALSAKRISTDAAHFITFRNNLNKLLHCPYNARDAWEMGVSRHGRTIRLHVMESDAKREAEARRTERERRMAYWGYAFEAACTRPKGEAPEPANANCEFCVVVQTKLGGNRVLFAAEMDCERPAEGKAPPKAREYLELKTTKLLATDRDRATLERHKMAKWWLQSFLVGVRRVVCGFRDDDGILRKVQDFETRQLPKFVRGAWKPQVMLNFGSEALGWLYDVVVQGPPEGRYVLSYDPSFRRLKLRAARPGELPESDMGGILPAAVGAPADGIYSGAPSADTPAPAGEDMRNGSEPDEDHASKIKRAKTS